MGAHGIITSSWHNVMDGIEGCFFAAIAEEIALEEVEAHVRRRCLQHAKELVEVLCWQLHLAGIDEPDRRHLVQSFEEVKHAPTF